jgi:hypothetical protein
MGDRVTCAGFTGWPRYEMISSSFRSGSSMYSENSRTLALHSRGSALQNSVGNQDKLSQPAYLWQSLLGRMHCFRRLILRYRQYHRPVASWPPSGEIQICASNLDRKLDNCQPTSKLSGRYESRSGQGRTQSQALAAPGIGSSGSTWIDWGEYLNRPLGR